MTTNWLHFERFIGRLVELEEERDRQAEVFVPDEPQEVDSEGVDKSQAIDN